MRNFARSFNKFCESYQLVVSKLPRAIRQKYINQTSIWRKLLAFQRACVIVQTAICFRGCAPCAASPLRLWPHESHKLSAPVCHWQFYLLRLRPGLLSPRWNYIRCPHWIRNGNLLVLCRNLSLVLPGARVNSPTMNGNSPSLNVKSSTMNVNSSSTI